MVPRALSIAAYATGLLGAVAQAQSGVIGGTVVRDSAGHGLGDAQISVPALHLQARTNFNGEFRINGVPVGRYPITIRRLGFAQLTDTVAVAAGQVVDREFVLIEQPAQLDSQVVVAKSEEVEPQLREFEEHRKRGSG